MSAENHSSRFALKLLLVVALLATAGYFGWRNLGAEAVVEAVRRDKAVDAVTGSVNVNADGGMRAVDGSPERTLPFGRPEIAVAGGCIALLLATTFAAWTVDATTHMVVGLSRAYTWMASLLVEAVLIDQWAGGPLSFTSIFGFSPLWGARYYGISNEMAAVLVGAAICGAGLLLDAQGWRWWGPWAERWGVAVLGSDGKVVYQGTLENWSICAPKTAEAEATP